MRKEDTHSQTGQEWVFQVIGSAQNCLGESCFTQPLNAELASMYIKAVVRMANSCAKPKCQDLLNTYSFRKLPNRTHWKKSDRTNYLSTFTFRCFNLLLWVVAKLLLFAYGRVIAYLRKGWRSIPESLQEQACKEMSEIAKVSSSIRYRG